MNKMNVLLTAESLSNSELNHHVNGYFALSNSAIRRNLSSWEPERIRGFSDIFITARYRLLQNQAYTMAEELSAQVQAKFFRPVEYVFGAPKRRWFEAVHKVALGDHWVAEELFRECERHFTNDPNFLLNRGSNLRRSAHFQRAIHMLTEAAALANSEVGTRLQSFAELARSYVQSGQFDNAATTVDEIRALVEAQKPDHRTFWLDRYSELIVDLLIAADGADEAIAFLNRSRTTGNSRHEVQPELYVRAYLALGKQELAVGAAQAGVGKANNYRGEIELYRLLGRNYRVKSSVIKHVTTNLDKPTTMRLPHPETGDPVTFTFSAEFAAAYAGLTWALGEGLFSIADAFLLDGLNDALQEPTGSLALVLLRTANSHEAYIQGTGAVHDFMNEVAANFADNPFVAVNLGHYYFAVRRYSDARKEFSIALQTQAFGKELLSFHLALSEIALDPEAPAQQDLDTIYESLELPDKPVASNYLSAWAINSGNHLLAVKCAKRIELELGGYLSHPRLSPTLVNAGHASLALRDFSKAANFFNKATSQHLREIALKSFFPTHRTEYTQLNALWGIASVLANDLEEGRERASVAQFGDSRDSTFAALKCLLTLKEDDPRGAVKQFRDLPPDSGITRVIGAQLLRHLDTADVADESQLRLMVTEVLGTAPSRSELLGRVEQLKIGLGVQQDLASRVQERERALTRSLELMIAALPLSPVDESLRQELLADLSSGRDLSAAVEAFVADWTNRPIETQSAPSRYLANTHRIRDVNVRKRIEAAESYSKVARKQDLDFGPSFLSLSSALEHLARTQLIRPIAAALKKSNVPRHERPSIVGETLGTVTSLLPPPAVVTFPAYRAFLHQLMIERYGELETFMLTVAAETFQWLAPKRNAWAHGRDSITETTYARLEAVCFYESPSLFEALGNPQLA